MLRILTTSDLIGSFFPHPASHGQVPGARALAATVQQLREASDAALWIDTGDFAQGSPLGSLTDGTWTFLAARELSIDVGVVGNHELDWGVEHLKRWSTELPFPLLAANADLGFPDSALLEVGGWQVGVVGLTYPHMPRIHPEVEVASDTVPLVESVADRLRRDGADIVVLALHDGVDLGPGETAPEIGLSRMEAFCAGLRHSVDLVLGGHTLGFYCGKMAGVPFVQPWPFSAQVGVADVDRNGGVELSVRDVEAGPAWDGFGAATHEQLGRQIVGTLDRPLVGSLSGDVSLGEAIAESLLAGNEAIDLTVVAPWDLWNQAPLDGVFAYLPAGEVSLAQVLRLTPMSGARSAWGGQLLVGELPSGDADRAVAAIATQPYYEGGPAARGAAIARRASGGPTTTVCLTPFYASRTETLLGRRIRWDPIDATWRTALIDALDPT